MNAKGLTVDYLNRNIITFENMKQVAVCMNNIIPEHQQQLHNKQYLEKKGKRVNPKKTNEELMKEDKDESTPEEVKAAAAANGQSEGESEDKKKDTEGDKIKFIESANRFQFNFNKSNKNIKTVYQNKIIQNTAGLKRFIINNRTYPYGYTGKFFS